MEKLELSAVSNGAVWLREAFKEILPESTLHVLDYFHCKENIWKFYELMHPDNEEIKKAKCDAAMERINRGEVDKVI